MFIGCNYRVIGAAFEIVDDGGAGTNPRGAANGELNVEPDSQNKGRIHLQREENVRTMATGCGYFYHFPGFTTTSKAGKPPGVGHSNGYAPLGA